MASKDQAGAGSLSAERENLEQLRKSIEENGVDSAEETAEQPAEEEKEDSTASTAEADGTDEVEEEEESAETPTQETTEPTEEEWFVPGQFKTKDDFVKSYRELQGAFTRTSQELSKLRTPGTTAKQADPQQEIIQFAKKVETNPVTALRELAREEAKTVAQQESEVRNREQAFVNTYFQLKQNKEFAELEPVMCELANQFSDMFQDQNLAMDPRLFNALYFMAKGVKQNQILAEAKQKAELKGELKGRKKQKVQVEGGSSSKGRISKNSDDMTLDELRDEITRGNLG